MLGLKNMAEISRTLFSSSLPRGSQRYASGTTPTAYRYTGQRLESSIGLYDYGARFYDPQLGRWIQPDTIVPENQGVQAFDRFAYVSNNPLKYTDPSGHQACDPEGGCNGLKPEHDNNTWVVFLREYDDRVDDVYLLKDAMTMQVPAPFRKEANAFVDELEQGE